MIPFVIYFQSGVTFPLVALDKIDDCIGPSLSHGPDWSNCLNHTVYQNLTVPDGLEVGPDLASWQSSSWLFMDEIVGVVS